MFPSVGFGASNQNQNSSKQTSIVLDQTFTSATANAMKSARGSNNNNTHNKDAPLNDKEDTAAYLRLNEDKFGDQVLADANTLRRLPRPGHKNFRADRIVITHAMNILKRLDDTEGRRRDALMHYQNVVLISEVKRCAVDTTLCSNPHFFDAVTGELMIQPVQTPSRHIVDFDTVRAFCDLECVDVRVLKISPVPGLAEVIAKTRTQSMAAVIRSERTSQSAYNALTATEVPHNVQPYETRAKNKMLSQPVDLLGPALRREVEAMREWEQKRAQEMEEARLRAEARAAAQAAALSSDGYSDEVESTASSTPSSSRRRRRRKKKSKRSKTGRRKSSNTHQPFAAIVDVERADRPRRRFSLLMSNLSISTAAGNGRSHLTDEEVLEEANRIGGVIGYTPRSPPACDADDWASESSSSENLMPRWQRSAGATATYIDDVHGRPRRQQLRDVDNDDDYGDVYSPTSPGGIRVNKFRSSYRAGSPHYTAGRSRTRSVVVLSPRSSAAALTSTSSKLSREDLEASAATIQSPGGSIQLVTTLDEQHTLAVPSDPSDLLGHMSPSLVSAASPLMDEPSVSPQPPTHYLSSVVDVTSRMSSSDDDEPLNKQKGDLSPGGRSRRKRRPHTSPKKRPHHHTAPTSANVSPPLSNPPMYKLVSVDEPAARRNCFENEKLARRLLKQHMSMRLRAAASDLHHLVDADQHRVTLRPKQVGIVSLGFLEQPGGVAWRNTQRTPTLPLLGLSAAPHASNASTAPKSIMFETTQELSEQAPKHPNKIVKRHNNRNNNNSSQERDADASMSIGCKSNINERYWTVVLRNGDSENAAQKNGIKSPVPPPPRTESRDAARRALVAVNDVSSNGAVGFAAESQQQQQQQQQQQDDEHKRLVLGSISRLTAKLPPAPRPLFQRRTRTTTVSSAPTPSALKVGTKVIRIVPNSGPAHRVSTPNIFSVS
eukprot:PhM_4_TR16719/c0_g1_i1/m.95175